MECDSPIPEDFQIDNNREMCVFLCLFFKKIIHSVETRYFCFLSVEFLKKKKKMWYWKCCFIIFYPDHFNEVDIQISHCIIVIYMFDIFIFKFDKIMLFLTLIKNYQMFFHIFGFLLWDKKIYFNFYYSLDCRYILLNN